MQSLKNQLPPLEPLVAFEAAARHRSFTLAAKELSLSQAAVSQQIRNLERSLGVTLFIRGHKSVRLSDQGKIYRNSISSALQQLASASQELKRHTTQPRLTLAVDQSIAAMWLMPKLPLLRRSYPSLNFRLVASDNERDCLANDVGLAIIHGDGQWSGFDSELLFPEEVLPVCSPNYLAEHPAATELANLPNQTLLHLENSHWNWMDWRTWLSSNDIHLPVSHHELQINNYPLLIEAAKNGQGIALGWRYLIDDHLATGALVPLFEQSVSTRFGYHLVWPYREKQDSQALLIRDWVKEQL